MVNPAMERGVLVFSTWTALGMLSLALFLEGLALNSYAIALAGVAALVAAFTAHIVINALFRTGYTRGETALGLSVFGVIVLLVVAGYGSGRLDEQDFLACLTLFAVLVVGFLGYLVTRHGLRGAYSSFHHGTGGGGSR